jgi:uncharacterized protein (DUF3820 family)
MNDDSIMPWGIHKGKRMADVPDAYLYSLWYNDKCWGEVKQYIHENLQAILNNLKIRKCLK